MSEKIDPHGHKKSYLNWKNKGMPLEGLCEEDKKILIRYLEDMEMGINVSLKSKKGSRSYGVLRNQRSKLTTFFRNTYNEYGIPITELDDEKLLKLLYKMRNGEILSDKGREYRAVGAFVKSFKSFWNWWIKVNRKQGKLILDITEDADKRDPKPRWNYFSIEDLQKLCDNAIPKYRIMMMFLFDSGIRAPTELMNVKVSDLEWDKDKEFYHLNIREETSKTFGRKIKLLICSRLLRSHLKENKLKKSDYLFPKTSSQKINQYLARLGYKVLGVGKATQKVENGKKNGIWITEGLKMYDFRHSSACHFLTKYKAEAALKYRFGWVKSDKIKYYTEYLGMKDNLTVEDLHDEDTKTELENKIKSLQENSEIEKQNLRMELEELKSEMAFIRESIVIDLVNRKKLV